MLKVRDPLNLAQRDPELRARMWWHEHVVGPICFTLIAVPTVFTVIVVIVELFKHG